MAAGWQEAGLRTVSSQCRCVGYGIAEQKLEAQNIALPQHVLKSEKEFATFSCVSFIDFISLYSFLKPK